MTTRNPTLRSFLNGKHSKKTVFNFVYNKVLEQGKASLGDGNRCAYRSSNGKCAAGHLIPDREMNAIMKVDPSVNNGGVYCLLDALDIPVRDTNGMKVNFIRDLQRAHDEAAFRNDGRASDAVFIKQYKQKMATLAKKHGL